MSDRQHVSDQSAINPHTGLPKHVYDYHHSQCKDPHIRGYFQMRRKKYHTKVLHYKEGDAEGRSKAIEETVKRLHELKKEVGYYDYLNNRGWERKVKEKSRNEYRNKMAQQNDWKSSTVLESLRYGNITRRHI